LRKRDFVGLKDPTLMLERDLTGLFCCLFFVFACHQKISYLVSALGPAAVIDLVQKQRLLLLDGQAILHKAQSLSPSALSKINI